jgi:hypothetical protein
MTSTMKGERILKGGSSTICFGDNLNFYDLLVRLNDFMMLRSAVEKGDGKHAMKFEFLQVYWQFWNHWMDRLCPRNRQNLQKQLQFPEASLHHSVSESHAEG